MDLKSGSAPGYERGVLANPGMHCQFDYPHTHSWNGWMDDQTDVILFRLTVDEPLKNASPIHIRTRSLVQLQQCGYTETPVLRRSEQYLLSSRTVTTQPKKQTSDVYLDYELRGPPASTFQAVPPTL